MRALWIPVILLGLSLTAPVGSAEIAWRATGIVTSVQGDVTLLALPAIVGNAFTIDFSYDDLAADMNPGNVNSGRYPLLGFKVKSGGNSLDFVGPGIGEGSVNIEASTTTANLWGVNGCLIHGTLSCSSPLLDEARVNLFFPPNTLLSDALTPPPDPGTATTVQVGLYSRNDQSPTEALVVASLSSLVKVIPGDADADGVPDGTDNCSNVANGPLHRDAGGLSQLDTDLDGYGNICDGDLNNSGTVTSADYALLRSVLGQFAWSSATSAAADLNGSGMVTIADYSRLRAGIGKAPGPSGLAENPVYTTSFDLTENPIFEGGAWHRAYNSFTNLRTANGIAFGTNGITDTYDDSYALLEGFGPDQSAEATIVRSGSLVTGITHEVELLLRFSDDNDNARGYECLFSYGGITEIVRWNGVLGDFAVLDRTEGPGSLGADLVSGDVVKATMFGNVISLYINGALMARAVDSTYTTGQPGIAFFTRPGGNSAHFGLTSYTVMSN